MLEFLKKIKREKVCLSLNNTPKQLPSFEAIKNICFGYVLTSVSSVKELISIAITFKQMKLQFTSIVIEAKNGIIKKSKFIEQLTNNGLSADNFKIIHKKQLSFIGVPLQSNIEEIMSQHFDLFISFNSDRNFTLDYLSLKISSSLSIGKQESWHPTYTIIIEGDNKTILSDLTFTEQIFNYLKVISTNG